MMERYLEVDDEFKRTLGYLPDDESLDSQTIARMKSSLSAAETFVQNSIGKNDKYYQNEDNKMLYKMACYSIASNWFNHPSTAASSTVAKAVIGQMRGVFDDFEEQENGTTSEFRQTNADD